MGAKVANTAKQFQFKILIPGLNPFLCQKVKNPDIEIDIAEHGDTGIVIKTAGMKKVGPLTIDKIFSSIDIDKSIPLWMNSIINAKTGGGAIPSIYKKNIIVQQLGNDNISILQQWVCEGAFPTKRNGVEFDRKSSENSTESIEFSVDDVDDL